MAIDMFLKVDGIKGESPDAQHKDEISIESFSFGVHQTGTSANGGGGGAGKASFEDIHVTKKADVASPLLMEACATGKHIKSALLTVRKAGGKQEDYYKIKLTDLLVTSHQNTGHGADTPMEQVSLNFSKIQFEYYPQKPDGTLGGVSKSGWDIKQNISVA
jgi:type VI secretion system secreted protein Hcp